MHSDRKLSLLLLMLFAVLPAHAGILERGKVQLICHRTANRDMPENTLESLALAGRMGCNIVEIDIRKTLDGQLVLNHDDFLERLTNGMGNVELTSYDELQLLDAGAWMGDRFRGMRIPRFDDALRIAREQGIGLDLDIKTKGIAPILLESLEREGMLQRVIFGGEWQDVKALYPDANRDPVAWVEPGCIATQVAELQHQGKFVVANFSGN
jgi:glycerophosphoryl diester phosphodiesterase